MMNIQVDEIDNETICVSFNINERRDYRLRNSIKIELTEA